MGDFSRPPYSLPPYAYPSQPTYLSGPSPSMMYGPPLTQPSFQTQGLSPIGIAPSGFVHPSSVYPNTSPMVGGGMMAGMGGGMMPMMQHPPVYGTPYTQNVPVPVQVT